MIRTIIVEGDPMAADIAAGQLERIEGFSLDHTARSAEDGLELLRVCHIDAQPLETVVFGTAKTARPFQS